MSTLEDMENGINRESTLFPSFDVATTPRSKKKTKKDNKKKKRNARKQFFGNYDSDSSSSSSSNSSSSANSSNDSDDESTVASDNIVQTKFVELESCITAGIAPSFKFIQSYNKVRSSNNSKPPYVKANVAAESTKPSNQAILVTQSRKFKPVKCWGCGHHHNLCDCPTTSDEQKQVLYQQKREEKERRTNGLQTRSAHQQANRADTPKTEATPITKTHQKTPSTRGSTPLEQLDEFVPGMCIMVDLVKNPVTESITSNSYFPFHLTITDMASRFFVPMGIRKKTYHDVFVALQEWATSYGPGIDLTMHMMRRIHGDYDSAFRNEELRSKAAQFNIKISFAAPRYQEQNGIHEANWRNIRNLAFAMMNPARVPKKFFHFAFENARKVHAVLTHNALTRADAKVQTPLVSYSHIEGRSIDSFTDFHFS